MNSRNTNQKKIILETLIEAKTHPTIDELYKLISEKKVSIGRATLYRNLKKFIEENKIKVIKTKKGLIRYDYNSNHIHYECLNCEEIFDIYDDEFINLLNSRKWNENKKIIDYNFTIYGYCDDCNKKLND